MQKYSIHASYTFHVWKWSILTTEVQSEEWNFYWNIDKINHQDCSWPTRSSRANYNTFDDAEIQMFHFVLDTFQVDEKEKLSIHEYLISKDPKMQDFILLRQNIEWKAKKK